MCNVYDYECECKCECEWTNKKRCEWVISVNGQWMKHEISFSLDVSLSLSYVEPPPKGGGTILGTIPHPAMMLNAITISIFITINVIINLTMLIIPSSYY